MQLDKLSSPLALAAYEFDTVETLEKPDVVSPLPKNRPQAFSVPGNISASEITGSTEVWVFIHLVPEAAVDVQLVLPAGATPVRFHSKKGRIRVARVPLASLGALSDLPEVLYISASMRLRPLTDLTGVGTKLDEFLSANPGLTQTGVVIGVINSNIGSVQAAFPGSIHSVWNQKMQGTGWDDKEYGTVIPAADLGAIADLDESFAAIADVALAFNGKFTAPEPNKVVIVKTDFQSARVADAVHYIFKVAEELQKPAVVISGLDGLLDSRADADDLSRFIASEKGQNFVVPPVGIDTNSTKNKQKQVPNRPKAEATIDKKIFDQKEISFFVSSETSQNGGVSHFVLRGWYQADGKCEIIIKSPDGGAKSTDLPQSITVSSVQDTVRYTTYKGSKVFLTIPVVSKVVNDCHEFYIDVRPLEDGKLITAGTWNLLFKNFGTSVVDFTVLSWVPEDEKELKFGV